MYILTSHIGLIIFRRTANEWIYQLYNVILLYVYIYHLQICENMMQFLCDDRTLYASKITFSIVILWSRVMSIHHYVDNQWSEHCVSIIMLQRKRNFIIDHQVINDTESPWDFNYKKSELKIIHNPIIWALYLHRSTVWSHVSLTLKWRNVRYVVAR